MKQARATPDDIRRVRRFFLMIENAISSGEVPDSQLLVSIGQAWAHRGSGVGTSWRRVVEGMETLLNECTDPELTYLDWRPDLKALLAPAESKVGD